MSPLAIDLFCGLGGWTEGLLAEGYRVVGFDIERLLLDLTHAIDDRDLEMLCAARERIQAARVVIGMMRRAETKGKD